MAEPSSRSVPVGVAGLVGAAFNIVAVIALQPVPHTYRPGDLDAWLAESLAVPGRIVLSGWAFTVGLVSLAAWAVGLWYVTPARSRAGMLIGALYVALGALLDAVGTMLPVAALSTDAAVARALLRVALLLDASFNGLLGVGLIVMGLCAGKASGWPASLRALCVVAGVASVPVALQFHADAFARLLVVAGPLWLAFVVWSSLRLLRSSAPAGAAR